MKGLVKKLEKVTAIRERERERVEGCLVVLFGFLVVKRR